MTPDGMTGFSQFLTSQEGALRSGVFFGLSSDCDRAVASR
jgi:hypothetical protein